VLVGIGGEVNSLFIVVALLVSRGLGVPSYEGGATKPKKSL
jgi:hypothetical protein